MSRFHSYINTAKTLIETFKGEKPFAVFLKQFFAVNKKYGSRDRRHISSLCYNYFRIGFAVADMPIDQRMIMATFLIEKETSALLENLHPEWNKKISLPIEEKLALINLGFSLKDIFPFCNELSNEIEIDKFCKSFLIQPDLFLRIRPQSIGTVLKKLKRSTLDYRLVGEHCLQLTISDKVADFFIIDKEVVVQDYNSQKVLDYLKDDNLPIHPIVSKSVLGLSVWDCCAASGGKSILLHDIIKGKIQLTVSDKRASIFLNLHQRFKKAGIKEYKYFITDISSADFKPGEQFFDLIICDAPCSGSGTWSRTPEQLYLFKKSAIEEYSSLQKKIVANVITRLQKEGLFIYITCSVFKKENELVAKFIANNFNCKLVYQHLLKGYDKKADNMFVAVFSKL